VDDDASSGETIAEVDGGVTELAASRDGKRLAYGLRRPVGPKADCASSAIGTVPELRVRDLGTGRTTVWHGLPGEGTTAQHVLLTDLSFAADGRHVAYESGDCCEQSQRRDVRVLDTGDGGGSFVTPAPVGVKATGCTFDGPAFRGRHGDLAMVRDCPTTDREVVTVDPATGAVTGVLFAVPHTPSFWGRPPARMVADASGEHLLVVEHDVETGTYVTHWDGRLVVRLDEQPSPQLAW
jgi:hypothetical protein